jgi:Fe-Mn family superoxide dismutase
MEPLPMFSLPDLPYAYDALAPVMSERTLRIHHGKHQAAYVATTNRLLEEAGYHPESLEDVIRRARAADNRTLFNNAAQAWNHAFFWVSMTAEPAPPSGEFAALIDEAFGDLATLRERLIHDGAGHFGSGWLWLIADRAGHLQVRTTHDADDVVVEPGLTPLIACDLWEHAYYLDHENDRKAFLGAWFDQLPNWAFAARQYAAISNQGHVWRHPASDAPAAPASRRASAG